MPRLLCAMVPTSALIALRHGVPLAAGSVLDLDILAVRKCADGPGFRILHDCTA
jgi:hypothetical protein